MSIKDDLGALCTLEAKISALTEQRDILRRRLLDHALDSFEQEGAAPTWRAGDLGTVGLTVPKPRVEVYDEDAFAGYVLDAYGDGAVEKVVRVKDNVRKAVLETVREGDATAGVTVQARLPYLQVRLTKEAKAAAAAELAADSEEAAA